MQFQRYRRQLAPDRAETLPQFLNFEFQKLERTIESIREALEDHEARIAALEP